MGASQALLGTCATFTLVPAAQVVEVDAFCSVQDMIQAAIASYGAQASLREVRYFCHGVSYAARYGCGRLCKVNLLACRGCRDTRLGCGVDGAYAQTKLELEPVQSHACCR